MNDETKVDIKGLIKSVMADVERDKSFLIVKARALEILAKLSDFEQLKEDIDATLDPLLQRAVTKSGAGFKIVLGGDDIDYSLQFQLYLQMQT